MTKFLLTVVLYIICLSYFLFIYLFIIFILQEILAGTIQVPNLTGDVVLNGKISFMTCFLC